MSIKCKICKRKPGDIPDYISRGREYGMSPEAYVTQEEKTYNHETRKFYCTQCQEEKREKE